MSTSSKNTAPAEAVESAGPAAQFLTFTLGEEVFAMDIRTVHEIIQHGAMTKVPLMPGFVRGVINLRGAVVPVIDLHARFGRGAARITKKTCIVIFDAVNAANTSTAEPAAGAGERVQLGLMVDAVNEVIEIASAQIEPAPNFGATVRRDFIRGMGKVGQRFVILLDPDRAFDVAEMADLCEASQQVEPAAAA